MLRYVKIENIVLWANVMIIGHAWVLDYAINYIQELLEAKAPIPQMLVLSRIYPLA